MTLDDDLTPVTVRGECKVHGVWTEQVPRVSAAMAKDQCPECTPALKPVRFEMVTLEGECHLHGPWEHPVLKQLATKMDGRCPTCDKIVADAQDQAQRQVHRAAVVTRRASHMRNLIDGAEIPVRFAGRSFENYRLHDEGGEAQAETLKRAQRFASNFPKAMELGANFVFCGQPGAGKTHLACAIANAVMHQHGASALFVTVFDVIQRVKETYSDRDRSERSVMLSFSEPDLLILDEVGVQFGTDYEKVIITDIINRRYNAMRPTIILSNLDETELGVYLGARVMDRMYEGGGGVIAFSWGSYRAKVLEDKALPRGKYQAPDWMSDDE